MTEQLNQRIDIVTCIRQRLNLLTPSEKQIAEFILTDLSFAASAPIAALAEKAKVSHASITRLAKTLDCANVRELKLRLAQSSAIGKRFTHDVTVAKKDIPEIYQSIQDALIRNAGLIDAKIIQQASELISQARQVLIFGVGGGSSTMAQECQNRLFRLDVISNAYSDPMLMRMAAATIDKQDLLLCLSLSGISPDVQQAADIAKEYGATVISICPDGPLSEISQFHLPIETDESDYIFKPSSSRYVMLAAIDILVSEVAVINQRKSREKLRRIKLHLDQHRQSNQRLPLGD